MRKMPAIVYHVVLLLLSTAVGTQARADHPEDACPDIHVPGTNSLDGYTIHQSTYQQYSPGQVVPLNTPLRVTGHAVATGHCEIRLWNGSTCIAGPTYLREVIAINNWQTTISHRRNSTALVGTQFTPLAYEQDFDGGTESPTTAPYVNFENEGGTFKFQQRMGVGTTTCQFRQTRSGTISPSTCCPSSGATTALMTSTGRSGTRPTRVTETSANAKPTMKRWVRASS